MECKMWLLTTLALRQPLAQSEPGSESCVPVLLLCLLLLLPALLSIMAHRPRAPQGTAFCREPDRIICSVGVKLIVTAGTAGEESWVTFVTLQAVSQGRPGLW